MTIRLLSTYDGFSPNDIITIDSALEASFIAAGNATANLTGGVVAYRERQPVMIQPAVQKRGTVNLIANRKATVPLTEGSLLTITPTAGTTGTYQRYDAAGAAVGALTTIGATVLTVGPFEGDFTVEAKCTTGSMVVKTADTASGALTLDRPFAGYVAMLPGVQGVNTGSAKSLAGNPLAEAYPSALTGRGTLTDAQMWATPGYMSTVSATGGQIEIPLTGYAPDLSKGQGQLLFFRVKAAAPAAAQGLITMSNGAVNPAPQGFSIVARTDGTVSIQRASSAAAGVAQALGNSAGVFCDNTEHSGMLYVHPSGYTVLWRDGELDTVFSINPSVPLGATTPTAPLTFGSNTTVAGNPATVMAANFKGVHLISFDTLPLNLNQIAKTLHENSMTPLRNSDIMLASKAAMLYWGAGQSNESGAGNTPGIVGPVGIPDRDALSLTASRSIKSGLAKRLAARGVAALWGNSAMGSTGIADAWVGRIRNWASNTNILGGSYVLNAGTVWKCTNAAGFSALSTVAPAAGTGSDTITWASQGAPTAQDMSVLAGTGIYPSTSPRFDPNGLLALADARAALAASTTTERVALISIGQGDRYSGVSRAAYSDAIQKVAAYHLARNATKVLVCMTVRSAVTTDYTAFNGGGATNADNDTSDHWYDRQLLPGRVDALKALANDPRVFAGWDWATGIGPVTGQTSPTAIGVKTSDGLVHMTDATYEALAVPLADDALRAAGV